jgi:hypothetical protein
VEELLIESGVYSAFRTSAKTSPADIE